MSEILLQAIVEKLEALGPAVLKLDNITSGQALAKEIKSFQTEIKFFRENLKLINDNMNELTRSLNKHAFQLGQPVKSNIEHRHVLYKGIWVAIALFNISMILVIGWNNALQTQKQFEANDIKYRSLKVVGDKGLIKLLYSTDSLYNLNAEAVRKRTIQEEQRMAKKAELFRLTSEKEKEAKELKRRVGTK